jgi:tetratricopeptide (TPR) repeat protein
MRLALRDLLGEEGRERALRNVQAILTEAGRGWPDGQGHWDLHRAVAAHVLPARLISSTHLATVRVVHNQIRYRYLMKDLDDARRLGEAAVTAWRERPDLGADHELVLLASREWANALRALGRYEQAREITADAMRRMRDDHPFAREIARSHAADLRIAGEYGAALALDRGTYESYREEFTDEHDRTVGGRHNLAVCLRLLGEFREAEEIDRAEVRYQRGRDGDAHRRTLRTLLAVNALAEDLFGLGRFADALEAQRKAFEASRSALGRGDESMLLARRMVALCRRRLGEAGAAAAELEATYRVCAGFWGADHEISLAAAMSCANALLADHREGEAYALAVEAVGTYERVFGQDNPLTRAAQLNLAVILRAAGDRLGARRLDTAALDGLRATVGERHPFAVVAMTNLASDLAHDGDHTGAYTLSLQAWRTAAEIRGAEHLDTLVAAANLVLDREAAGKVDEGPDHEAVLAALRRSAGQDHPLVALAADHGRLNGDLEPPST